MNPLSVFISYSHADKPVARDLAAGLEASGLKVWLDEGELRAGDSIIQRIATAISEVDFVVALVSKDSVQSQWCQKELALGISGELAREGVKVLPLRLGDVNMPVSLADVFYRAVDRENLRSTVDALVQDARSHRSEQTRKPVVIEQPGPGPDRSRARPGNGANARVDEDDGPIRILGIVREGIGKPRSDNTPGSALYAVPFRLSRSLDYRWASHLQKIWDSPPHFTTMHRPRVCRVNGDVVTLNGVTMDEVERYHLETLKGCIQRLTEDMAKIAAREAAEAARKAQLETQHESEVDDAIGRLNFD
ncbi:MAG: toll/interleukin-1 receptor domain-containing protein [Acidimicrobiales bacterium]